MKSRNPPFGPRRTKRTPLDSKAMARMSAAIEADPEHMGILSDPGAHWSMMELAEDSHSIGGDDAHEFVDEIFETVVDLGRLSPVDPLDLHGERSPGIRPFIINENVDGDDYCFFGLPDLEAVLPKNGGDIGAALYDLFGDGTSAIALVFTSTGPGRPIVIFCVTPEGQSYLRLIFEKGAEDFHNTGPLSFALASLSDDEDSEDYQPRLIAEAADFLADEILDLPELSTARESQVSIDPDDLAAAMRQQVLFTASLLQGPLIHDMWKRARRLYLYDHPTHMPIDRVEDESSTELDTAVEDDDDGVSLETLKGLVGALNEIIEHQIQERDNDFPGHEGFESENPPDEHTYIGRLFAEYGEPGRQHAVLADATWARFIVPGQTDVEPAEVESVGMWLMCSKNPVIRRFGEDLLDRLAATGDFSARYNSAVEMIRGRHSKKSPADGFERMLQLLTAIRAGGADKHGIAGSAARSIGACYKDGRGVEQNSDKALEYFKIGADHEDGRSAFFAGEMLQWRALTRGGPMDEAAKYFSLGMELSDTPSQTSLAALHITNSISSADFGYGIKLLQSSVNGGDHRARMLAEMLIKQGILKPSKGE